MGMSEIRETTEEKLREDYGGILDAGNDELYEAVYVAIDTNPRVDHRKFYDNLIGEIFFDKNEEQVIQINREERMIKWTPNLDGSLVPLIMREIGRISQEQANKRRN